MQSLAQSDSWINGWRSHIIHFHYLHFNTWFLSYKISNCILYIISIWNTIFQSAAAAPSPVLGNLPPGDGMPVGPVPPGFFQVWSTHVDNVNSDRKSKAPFHPSVLPPTLSKREEEKSQQEDLLDASGLMSDVHRLTVIISQTQTPSPTHRSIVSKRHSQLWF